MVKNLTTLTALALLAACGGGAFPGVLGGQADAGAAQAAPDGGGTSTAGGDGGGSSPDGGTAASGTGCGSGGGGPTGGPADLFPCDSPWYKDVSASAVAAESASIVSAIGSAGGWGLSNHFQLDFSAALIHGDASTRREVWVQPRDASDPNEYDPTESDLVSGNRAWSVPMPAGGKLEGESGYDCPVTSSGLRKNDCHLTVVDDSRHLLIELYSAGWDAASGKWFVTQESAWNLLHSYGAAERGRGCTSANAAGLPQGPGVIGIRETQAAAREPGGYLRHALRFALPPDRIRRAFVAPASHTQTEATSSGGPPFGARLRLKASFDESRVSSAGGKVVLRTLKKYGMVLTDGGQTILTADDDTFTRQGDASLVWGSTLRPLDLDGLLPSDFEVVDYDASTWGTNTGCVSGVDKAPLASITPQGFSRRGRRR